MIRRIVLQDAYRPYPPEELAALCEEGLLTPEVLENLDRGREYGVSWYGKEEVKRTRRGRKRKERPRSEWVPVPVPSSGVPADVVDRARAAIRDNARPSRADDILWTLTGGILHCPCGRRMLPKRVGGASKLYHYYSCGSYWRPSGERCQYAKSHPAKVVEERVADFVLTLIRDPEILRKQVEQQAQAERSRLKSADQETARWRERLTATEHRRSNLIDLAADGTISRDDLRSKLADLDKERKAVEAELTRLRNQGRHLRELATLPGLVEEYLRDLPAFMDRTTVVRDYETVPAERTEDNPLGAYRLTPERIRYKGEEELEAERRRADNERRARLRQLYEAIGLRCTLHPDGTLMASWRFGERSLSLPDVNTAVRSL